MDIKEGLSLLAESTKPLVLADVKIYPYDYGSMPMNGGAWHPNEPALRHSREKFIEKRPERFDEEDFKQRYGRHFYGGPLFLHFGHFLMESLSRLWAFDLAQKNGMIDASSKIIFNIFHENRFIEVEKLPKYVLEVLQILGLDHKRIEIVQEPTCFEELVVADQSCGLFFPITSNFTNFVHRARRLSESGTNRHITGGDLIYVSRQAYRTRGNYLGEATVESTLVQHGFKIFYPELHRVGEQIATFEAARGIVFAESSAIHLLSLCARFDGDIIVIKRRHREPFTKQLSDLKLRFSIIEPEAILPRIYPVGSRLLSYCNLNCVFDVINERLGTDIKGLSNRLISDAISTELCWHALKSFSQDPKLFHTVAPDLIESLKALPIDLNDATRAIANFSEVVQ